MFEIRHFNVQQPSGQFVFNRHRYTLVQGLCKSDCIASHLCMSQSELLGCYLPRCPLPLQLLSTLGCAMFARSWTVHVRAIQAICVLQGSVSHIFLVYLLSSRPLHKRSLVIMPHCLVVVNYPHQQLNLGKHSQYIICTLVVTRLDCTLESLCKLALTCRHAVTFLSTGSKNVNEATLWHSCFTTVPFCQTLTITAG